MRCVYDTAGRRYVVPRITASFRRVCWDKVNDLRRQWLAYRGQHWAPLPVTTAAIERDTAQPMAATAIALLAAGVSGLALMIGYIGLFASSLVLFLTSSPDSAVEEVNVLVAALKFWSLPVIAVVFFGTLLVVVLFRRRSVRARKRLV
ncbi:hypothetical protein [Fodinicola feengrottensis]|uniref:Uncharacterized protein n=1 Tax=Fodinicola feengrottensis TaxID=435914 RepID=A0ABP4T6Y7_9ACTN|nr:hypothetical protein [Fodinicola feengrottensis]